MLQPPNLKPLPVLAQELHLPPGRDGGAEHAVREDPVLDGPPAPEHVQELDEAGRFAGFHGDEPVRVGLEGILES